jgi:hypothetical protein
MTAETNTETPIGATHRERPAESFAAIAPNGERVMRRSA